MRLRELTHEEYLRTFSEPMRKLEEDDAPPVQVSLKEYLDETARALGLSLSLEAMQLEHVYVGGDLRYTHVLFNYGVRNAFVVIAIDNDAEAIFGHYVLVLATDSEPE